MALVVEDGTGKTDAESYASVATADTYNTEHGSNAAWTAASSAAKEAALRIATVYLDGHFPWSGVVSNATQALGWPRAYAYDTEGREIEFDTVPERIVDGCCYLAICHLSSALDATQARGGDIKREQVGPVEVEYMDRAVPGTAIPFIRQIIGGLCKAWPGQIIVGRA